MKNLILKYWVGLTATLIYLSLKFITLGLFPDWLLLSSVDPSSFFELLINATTSVFGILIAVILLTFEFSKERSYRRKGENILSKGVVINLVSLAVSVIVLSLISYSTIKDFSHSDDLSIGYFLGILFITFILLILPATKGILETANTLKKIKGEINTLTLIKVREISDFNTPRFISQKNEIALVRIREELLKSVRECDYEAYTAILQELNSKSIQLIGDGQDRFAMDSILQGVIFVWRAGNNEALRVENLQFFETIWECIDEQYEHQAKCKIELLNYDALNMFSGENIDFLTRHKLTDSLNSGTGVFSKSFRQNLRFNCPPQEELMELYEVFRNPKETPPLKNSDTQWDEINDILYRINQIQQSAIRLADKDLFEYSMFSLRLLLRDLGSNAFPNLGIYQEAFVAITIFSLQTESAYLCSKELLFKDTNKLYLDTTFIEQIIDKEKFYIRRILEIVSDFLIRSQSDKILNDKSVLPAWGRIARRASKVYLTNKTSQRVLNFILDTFEKLLEEMESQLPDQAQNYIVATRQIVIIRKLLIKNTIDPEAPVIKKINRLILKFQDIQPIEYSIVEWKDEIDS